MTAQDELKAVLRTVVAPAVRHRGYKGSGTTWVRSADNGDTAVVNVQSSQYSSAAEVRCVVNLAVIPSAWRDWQQTLMPNINHNAPKERNGLWRNRMHAVAGPADTHGWWQVSDARTAELAANDIVQQLDTVGLPKLERLLTRAAFIDSVRQQDLGFAKGPAHQALFDRALAVLLADEGPSDELTELLHQLDINHGDVRGETTRVLTDWARARAAAPQDTL